MHQSPHTFPTSKSTVKQDVNVVPMRCAKTSFVSVHQVLLVTHLLAVMTMIANVQMKEILGQSMEPAIFSLISKRKTMMLKSSARIKLQMVDLGILLSPKQV